MESRLSINVEQVQFDTLMDIAVDGIIVIGASGDVKAYNRACERLFGYSASEVIGRNVNMLMPSPYRENHDTYIANFHATGKKKIIGIGREVFGRHKDGSTFPMYLSVGEGHLKGASLFVGIIHDLTDRERAESRLRELQSELRHVSRLSDMGELASALAHELNQPLTAVTNYVKAAMRTLGQIDGQYGPVVQAKELMGKAAEQTLRAGHIVRRLRDFISKGETPRKIEDLNTVVEEALALALVGVADTGITVRKNLQSDLPPLLIDKIQIQQVVLNLVRNSVEALRDVSERALFVSTGFDKEGYVATVEVSDTGTGLAPEVVSQLFQPFVTTKKDGMGIGLSICRSIIESHGGRLWAEPRVGGGVSFHFRLPTRGTDDEERYDV